MEVTGGCLCKAVRYRITAAPKCGTPMFSESESRPHLMFVRSGTLDDPEIAKPSSTIWVSSTPTWACINESLPCIEAQPAPLA